MDPNTIFKPQYDSVCDQLTQNPNIQNFNNPNQVHADSQPNNPRSGQVQVPGQKRSAAPNPSASDYNPEDPDIIRFRPQDGDVIFTSFRNRCNFYLNENAKRNRKFTHIERNFFQNDEVVATSLEAPKLDTFSQLHGDSQPESFSHQTTDSNKNLSQDLPVRPPVYGQYGNIQNFYSQGPNQYIYTTPQNQTTVQPIQTSNLQNLNVQVNLKDVQANHSSTNTLTPSSNAYIDDSPGPTTIFSPASSERTLTSQPSNNNNDNNRELLLNYQSGPYSNQSNLSSNASCTLANRNLAENINKELANLRVPVHLRELGNSSFQKINVDDQNLHQNHIQNIQNKQIPSKTPEIKPRLDSLSQGSNLNQSINLISRASSSGSNIFGDISTGPTDKKFTDLSTIEPTLQNIQLQRAISNNSNFHDDLRGIGPGENYNDLTNFQRNQVNHENENKQNKEKYSQRKIIHESNYPEKLVDTRINLLPDQIQKDKDKKEQQQEEQKPLSPAAQQFLEEAADRENNKNNNNNINDEAGHSIDTEKMKTLFRNKRGKRGGGKSMPNHKHPKDRSKIDQVNDITSLSVNHKSWKIGGVWD